MPDPRNTLVPWAIQTMPTRQISNPAMPLDHMNLSPLLVLASHVRRLPNVDGVEPSTGDPIAATRRIGRAQPSKGPVGNWVYLAVQCRFASMDRRICTMGGCRHRRTRSQPSCSAAAVVGEWVATNHN